MKSSDWQWVAELRSGEFIRQFDGAQERPFSSVDLNQVVALSWESPTDRVRLVWPGSDAVIRRRHCLVAGKEEVSFVLGIRSLGVVVEITDSEMEIRRSE